MRNSWFQTDFLIKPKGIGDLTNLRGHLNSYHYINSPFHSRHDLAMLTLCVLLTEKNGSQDRLCANIWQNGKRFSQ